MTETIEVEVGELYASLHVQHSEQLGDQYNERLRAEVEELLHNINQQVERQQEMADEKEEPNLDGAE